MTGTVAELDAIVAAGAALNLNPQRNQASQRTAAGAQPGPAAKPATLRLYRQAREATVMEPWLAHRAAPGDAPLAKYKLVNGTLVELDYDEWREQYRTAHPEDAQRARKEAERRAGTKVRRYTRHHRLDHLVTCTYRRPHRELADVARDVANLLRQLRRHYGPTPAVVVAEPHPHGHGWHVHFACARFLPHKAFLRECWQHGHVFFTYATKRGKSPKVIARYLAKYVGKGFDPDVPPAAQGYAGVEGAQLAGRHRYWCSRGPRGTSFVPRPEVYAVADRQDGKVLGAVLLGRRRPRAVVHLDRKEDYYGPPGCWIDYW